MTITFRSLVHRDTIRCEQYVVDMSGARAVRRPSLPSLRPTIR